MSESLSRQLADYLSGLRYEDLPPTVIDKAKAVILHGLMVGLASHADSEVRLSRELILEDNPTGEARILGHGDRTSRLGAAFVNCILIHTRGQDDSYRMLTHPGSVVLPAALADAEGRGVDGKRLLTAIVAGYELQCRIARDFIPSSQIRGFRSSALFGIFGPTGASARLRNLDPERFANAIALAVSLAAGNLETSRAGTREMTYQEPVICQSAMNAVRLAERGVNGAPFCLEGAAGFFYAFTGNADGDLTGSFHGETHQDLSSIAEGLGSRWEITDVTMKIYSTAGFNQPVIEACTQLARDHDLTPVNVGSVLIEMNLWETVYPAPVFPPRRSWQSTDFGSTAYFAASTIAAKGYSTTGRKLAYGGGDEEDEPDAVRDLAKRVKVVAGDRRQYSPRVTIETTDGRTLVAEMTGEEFKWDLATERDRVESLVPALPFSRSQYERLVTAVATLDQLADIDELISLAVAQ